MTRRIEQRQNASHLREIARAQVIALSGCGRFEPRTRIRWSGRGDTMTRAIGRGRTAEKCFRRETPCWKNSKPLGVRASMPTIGRMPTCGSSSRGRKARARSCASRAPIGSSRWARSPRSSTTPVPSRRRSCSRRCRATERTCGFSPARPTLQSGSRSRSACPSPAIPSTWYAPIASA